jgi:hypothetical protein
LKKEIWKQNQYCKDKINYSNVIVILIAYFETIF